MSGSSPILPCPDLICYVTSVWVTNRKQCCSTVFVCIYESKLPQQNSSVLIWPQLSTCQESMACSLSRNCTNNSAEPCKILAKYMLESVSVPGSHCWSFKAGQVMISYTSHRQPVCTVGTAHNNNWWVSVLQRFHLGHTQLTVIGEPDCKLHHCQDHSHYAFPVIRYEDICGT